MEEQNQTFENHSGSDATDGMPNVNEDTKAQQGGWVKDGDKVSEIPAAPVTPQKSPDVVQASDNRSAQDNTSGDTSSVQVKSKKPIFIVLGVVVAILLIVYIAGTIYYSSRLLHGTSINDIDCSGKTVEQAQQVLKDSIADYSLTLQERNDLQETIMGTSIDLELQLDSTIDDTLASQNSFLWFTGFFGSENYTMERSVQYDEEKLETLVDALDAFNSDNVTKPVNAHVSDYTSGEGYSIVPEEEGNKLKASKTLEAIQNSITNLDESLNLDEAGLYKEPSIRSDNADLVALKDKMNKYVNTTITYKFGSKKEVLDGDTISTWLEVDNKKMTVSISDDSDSKLYAYVKSLASKYDTIYTTHTFKKTNGETIKISQGDYGWWTDQPSTRAELLETLNNFESKTLTPVYFQEAASYGDNDYGDAYVEVDLGNQVLYYYEKGECKLTSYFVSGNTSTGYTTPGGIYGITYKDTNHRMVGDDYDVFTYYWLPFNGNIGFHDATWRSSFGGSIYKTNGSHGCINMPLSKAKSLWNLVSKGTPVICYY